MKLHRAFFFSIAFALLTVAATGQNTDEGLVTYLSTTIYSNNFDKAQQEVLKFVEETDNVVLQQTETERSFYIEFHTQKAAFEQFSEMLENLGYVSSKEITTENYTNRIAKIELELNYQQEQKAVYEAEIASMRNKDERYYDYWETVRRIENEIFTLRTERQAYAADKDHVIKLSLYDETEDYSSNQMSLVNMPGVSYKWMFIENPVSDLSASTYRGYSLKYLFTRGTKTYFILGAIKEYDQSQNDTLRYKELFMYGIGQDFYTKYFGRGKNTFFNLYTSYNLGGVFATADTRRRSFFYTEVYFGLEIFKNKYFLIDNKVGYFIPFYQNRRLRGLTYNCSFNFVF